MRLAVSNLAWPIERDDELLDLIFESGIRGLELAPAKNFGELAEVSEAAVLDYRKRVEDKGLSIVAFQAFLFGHPELQLFDDRARPKFIKFITRVIDVAQWAGAGCLVYGAPKSRDRQGREMRECEEIAAVAFKAIGDYAAERGVTFCLEANPEEYGCNFIFNATQAAELVRRVGSPGFLLHLDTACMTLAGDKLDSTIRSNVDILAHFHASEPQLGDFEEPQLDHAAAAVALRESGYDGWVSIEMKEPADPPAGVKQAIDFVRPTYG